MPPKRKRACRKCASRWRRTTRTSARTPWQATTHASSAAPRRCRGTRRPSRLHAATARPARTRSAQRGSPAPRWTASPSPSTRPTPKRRQRQPPRAGPPARRAGCASKVTHARDQAPGRRLLAHRVADRHDDRRNPPCVRRAGHVGIHPERASRSDGAKHLFRSADGAHGSGQTQPERRVRAVQLAARHDHGRCRLAGCLGPELGRALHATPAHLDLSRNREKGDQQRRCRWCRRRCHGSAVRLQRPWWLECSRHDRADQPGGGALLAGRLGALLSILIFSLGILGMVAMGGTAMTAQSDAQYRTEAANLASEMASNIVLNVDRGANFVTSLPGFEHLRTNAGTCNFAGTASSNATVLNWVDQIRGAVPGVQGLPGATNTSESIAVDMSPTGHNKVTITICWKPPASSASPFSPWHQHVLVSYVNLN